MFNIRKQNISFFKNKKIKFIIYPRIDSDYLNETIINIHNYSYFSFKVHINPIYDLKIYKINPEQKIICQPKNINGKNICLFSVDIKDI